MKRALFLVVLVATIAVTFSMIAKSSDPIYYIIKDYLVDAEGRPLSSGTYCMDFTIYDADGSSPDVYVLTMDVPVEIGGYMSVILGPIPEDLFDDPTSGDDGPLNIKYGICGTDTPLHQITYTGRGEVGVATVDRYVDKSYSIDTHNDTISMTKEELSSLSEPYCDTFSDTIRCFKERNMTTETYMQLKVLTRKLEIMENKIRKYEAIVDSMR